MQGAFVFTDTKIGAARMGLKRSPTVGENTFPISIRCDSVSNNKTIRIRTIITVHAKEDLKN
jgi:hypothetical protein